MKRLTIDQTWEQCLAMWKWISRRCLGKSKDWCRSNVNLLKIEWMANNKLSGFQFHCFFCHVRTGTSVNGTECGCPAQEIDASFKCVDTSYHYMAHPRLFYAELKRLNKIRLSK